MKVHLKTLGCRLNEAELETWAQAFQKSGHSITKQAEAAQQSDRTVDQSDQQSTHDDDVVAVQHPRFLVHSAAAAATQLK